MPSIALSWQSASHSVLHEARHREIRPTNHRIRVAFWNLWEIIEGDELDSLSEGPVNLHWPEGNNVDIVHKGVGVRHL